MRGARRRRGRKGAKDKKERMMILKNVCLPSLSSTVPSEGQAEKGRGRANRWRSED